MLKNHKKIEYNKFIMDYTLKNKTIIITGGFKDQSIIDIPATVDGCPVTEIEKYAFSGREELKEVILPESIQRIGGHAFYNCKNLSHAELHDGIRELEDGAFKNCYSLSRITMHSHEGREGCIRNLMSDNIQEITLDIFYDNGERSRLFFPTFEDDYVENTPARIFQAVSYGTGGAYRQCMQVGTLDYRDFDRLFERSVREDRPEAAVFNCIGRLMYPYKLFNSAKEKYENYLAQNDFFAASVFIENRDSGAIKYMCEHKLICHESAKRLIEIAAEKENMEIFGLLMNYKNTNFITEKKRFDL